MLLDLKLDVRKAQGESWSEGGVLRQFHCAPFLSRFCKYQSLPQVEQIGIMAIRVITERDITITLCVTYVMKKTQERAKRRKEEKEKGKGWTTEIIQD